MNEDRIPQSLAEYYITYNDVKYSANEVIDLSMDLKGIEENKENPYVKLLMSDDNGKQFHVVVNTKTNEVVAFAHAHRAGGNGISKAMSDIMDNFNRYDSTRTN